MKEIKKNSRKNENPGSDKERNARKTPRNKMEIKKNRRANENPRIDKKLNFQQKAKEIEGDKEKQEKE